MYFSDEQNMLSEYNLRVFRKFVHNYPLFKPKLCGFRMDAALNATILPVLPSPKAKAPVLIIHKLLIKSTVNIIYR